MGTKEESNLEKTDVLCPITVDSVENRQVALLDGCDGVVDRETGLPLQPLGAVFGAFHVVLDMNALKSDAAEAKYGRTAGFPAQKTLEIYDFAFATGAPRAQIRNSPRSASSCSFHRHPN